MCKSITEIFGWLGAILVNLGFISLIAWGAAKQWVVGFGLSAIYTIVLFVAARFFETSSPEVSEGPSMTESPSANGYEAISPISDVDQDGSEQQQELDHRPRKFSIITNLLYALFIAGLGSCMFFLPGAHSSFVSSPQSSFAKVCFPNKHLRYYHFLPPVNLFNCEPETVPRPYGRDKWVTDTSVLPIGVRKWADENTPGTERVASFAYMPATGTTIFGARGEISSPGLYPSYIVWETRGDSAPKQQESYQSPLSFIPVAPDTACFKTSDSRLICLKDAAYVSVLSPTSGLSPYDLFVNEQDNDGLLWFKATDRTANGYRVQSFNASSKQLMNYSTLNHRKDNGKNDNENGNHKPCTYEDAARRVSIGSFFCVALPVILASLTLWIKRGIPSMGLTFVVGIELLYITLESAIKKNDVFDWDEGFGTWNLAMGVVLLVVLTVLHLVKDLECVNWGLNSAGIMLLTGMTTRLLGNPIGLYDSASIGNWVILNLFCFPTLIFLGMANKTVFLVFLGGLGILLDASKLVSITSEILIEANAVIVGFVIFAAAGLLEVALGLFLNKYQDTVYQKSVIFTKIIWEDVLNRVLPYFQNSVEGHSLLETETAPLRDTERTVVDRAYVANGVENEEERI